MSRTRHTARSGEVGGRRSAIATFSRDYRSGHRVNTHFHERDQLVYASCGVMTVESGGTSWVVPTHRAVWIPAGIPHSIRMSGAVSMRTLYLRPYVAYTLPRSCAVMSITPLLRELILHACSLPAPSRGALRQRHLLGLILDLLRSIRTVPLRLPRPSDQRARQVASLLSADPADRRPLEQISACAGASKRTLERLFQQQVGMSPGKWRQQLRLMQALRLLAEGVPVTQAALEAGYGTPSAFIAMFRRTLGCTPGVYFKADRSAPALRARGY